MVLFGRRLEHGELANHFVTYFGRTPARVLLFDLQDQPFNLVWELVGLSIRSSRSIMETFQSRRFVAIEDFVSGHSRDAELSTKRSHFLAF